MGALVRTIRQWFSEALWAPVMVLLFRWGAMRLGVREQLDHVIHGLGGAAIAYFLLRGLIRMEPYLGRLNVPARYLLAFSLACTVAVFWEFGEWAGDALRGTHIQHEVIETLGDLLSGVCGAIVTLAFVFLLERRGRPSRKSV